MRNKCNYISIITFCLVCSSFLLGCFDEIAFEPSENQLENLVIQGKLLKGNPSLITVRVTEVSAFSGPDVPIPVETASVILLDENQNELELIATDPGVFQLEIPKGQPGLEVEVGHAYQIRVLTVAGGVYESDLEPLLPVPTPDSMEVGIVSRQEINESGNLIDKTYLQFFVNTPLKPLDNGQKAFLKWETEGCYRFLETTPSVQPPPTPKVCYYKEDLNLDKVKVFNGQASSLEILNQHLLLETVRNYRFSQGYYLTVFQQSLSEKAFEYWNQVSQVVERTGSIFESTPGKIKGNLKSLNRPDEEVFGYFYVSIQDTIRFRVKAEDADYPSPRCPPIEDGVNPVMDVCFNCLLRPNSTLEKPDYWVD